MAYQGLLHSQGEVEMARGVAAAGGLLALSTRASSRIEDVAAVAGPWWLQAYITRDRDLIEGLVRRGAECGARAIVLTGDTPYPGRKARAGRPSPVGSAETLTNLGQHLRPGADPAHDAEQDPSITVDVIGWLAEISGLPVLVKGVLTGPEARRCIDAGAAGLIVSNHGGRQLDRAVPTALALPEVVAAAGDVPVLVDGGVRSALDVLVALALGARAVCVGRPLLWALAEGGADAVGQLLEAFRGDLAHNLGLAGYASCAQITADVVVPVGSTSR
jgi:4-hydroxymandelate oxidase